MTSSANDPIKIDNSELEKLPITHFEGEIVVVESPDQLQEACDYLLGCSILGFDTETRPSFTAGTVNKVALLQLSDHRRCYLFRLCRLRLDKSIIKILESPDIVKVGADIRNDLRALNVLRHFRPQGFVELQTVAKNNNIGEMGLRKMAAIVLGIRISKAQRLSNWEAATLTPAQQLYAATDAWVSRQVLVGVTNKTVKR